MDVTLHSLFEAWGTDQPARLTDLVNADYDTLDERAKGLRALAVHLVHSFERRPVYTAADARKLLEDHHLPVLKGKWCSVALSKDKDQIYVRADNGGMRKLSAVTLKFPTPDKVTRKAPLPEDGSYLIIYGGSPDVLSEEGVLDKVRALRGSVSIADIIFWEEDSTAATFYSVGVGLGRRGTLTVPFPDLAKLEEAQA